MRHTKTKSFALIVAIGVSPSYAKSIDLTLRYMPSSTYDVTEQISSRMRVWYAGDPTELDEQLSSQLPLLYDSEYLRERSIETGKALSLLVPYSVELQIHKDEMLIDYGDGNIVDAETLMSQYVGMSIQGTMDPSTGIQWETIQGQPIEDNNVIEALRTSSLSSGKSLVVGSTTSHRLPMNIPISPGESITIILKVSYTLESITGGIANLIIDTRLAPGDYGDVEVEVNGGGDMQYDAEQQYIVSKNNDTNVQITMPYQSSTMHIDTSIATELVGDKNDAAGDNQ